jgi:Lrp/AsnC family leucine-responsive transcriptional regulator
MCDSPNEDIQQHSRLILPFTVAFGVTCALISHYSGKRRNFMDHQDAAILRALQSDSRRPVAELAELLGLSASACHRRIKTLEAAGVIKGYAARIDRKKLGLTLHVFVDITLNSQGREVLEQFEKAVAGAPDILECHLTSGSADYMLRVVARDMADYDRIHRECLSGLPFVSIMHTTFVLRPVKPWQGYPVK